MLKGLLIPAALLLLGQSALAQAVNDPTFNGLVARANCQVRTVNACQSGACVQVAKGCQGDLCGVMTLFMKARQVGLDSAPVMPLQVTGVAPAEVGKTLWVIFLLPMKMGTGQGMFTLKPNSFGGYAGSAVVFNPDKSDPTGRSFMLFDYDCEQIPDGP